MNTLEGKVALVSGGGQGLGKAITQVLSEVGAFVIPADIRGENAVQVAEEIKQKGKKAEGMKLDIGDEKNIEQTISTIKDKYKKLDIVINNAAVDVTKPIEELSIEEIDRVIRINLRGTFLMSKFALHVMYEQKYGHIINIASTAALRTWTETTAYHATKWGVRGLSHALYAEARRKNVKVSTVIPGGMRTPFILERFPDTPLEKLQDPRTVAEVVKKVLLTPDESIIPEVMIIPMQEGSWP